MLRSAWPRIGRSPVVRREEPRVVGRARLRASGSARRAAQLGLRARRRLPRELEPTFEPGGSPIARNRPASLPTAALSPGTRGAGCDATLSAGIRRRASACCDASARGHGVVVRERCDPTPLDETLAEALAVTANAVPELDEVVDVRIRRRLLPGLHCVGLLPVLLTLEPSPEVSRAVGVHRRRLKGNGGNSPPPS